MMARRARSLASEPRDHLKERCPRCHRHGPGPGKLLARPTLAWILTYVLQEYARHAGHLDVARELIDGTTGE
jgi:Protein of unknown function (DUF664)